jgi:hypothetical protein
MFIGKSNTFKYLNQPSIGIAARLNGGKVELYLVDGWMPLNSNDTLDLVFNEPPATIHLLIISTETQPKFRASSSTQPTPDERQLSFSDNAVLYCTAVKLDAPASGEIEEEFTISLAGTTDDPTVVIRRTGSTADLRSRERLPRVQPR